MSTKDYHTTTAKDRRKKRVRAKLFGTAERPRVSVHRTNQRLSAQVIDDAAGKTLFSASDFEAASKDKKKTAKTKMERATMIGESLAEQLAQHKIKTVLFDRGQFRYHGRVKAVAEALRAQGVRV